MACYSPIFARVVPGLVSKNGKKVYTFLKDFEPKSNFQEIESGQVISIPCGKCIGCRLDKSREWADRMVLELDRMKKAVFVTLTYAPDFLPPTMVSDLGEAIYLPNESGKPISPLVKDHMPEFMKRLRSDLNYKENLRKFQYEYPELLNWKKDDGSPMVKVRFYGCGEYGEDRGRPHLHIILFGLSLADLAYLQGTSLRSLKKNEFGQITYRSDYLSGLWKKGNVDVSETSYNTMGYVSRYTMKKAIGSKYPEEHGLPPEFVLMSRSPGIGGYFLDDHPGRVDEVSTYHFQGKTIYWPKYLLQKEHSTFCDIEVFDECGSMHYNIPVLDDVGRRLLRQKQEFSVNKFRNSFLYDERPYWTKQDFLDRQKKSTVKQLVRGDVTLD